MALISGIITSIITKGEKKKRKILLSIFLPFQVIFSLYIFCIIGSAVVSEIENVDMGIGDSWYAPINESYKISMIDLPENAFIEYNGSSILRDVDEIQQVDNKIIGKIDQENYFAINLINNQITNYANLQELKNGEKLITLNLIKVDDFYQQKKWEVSGFQIILIGILSVILSFTIAIIIYRFIVYGKILGSKRM
nr:hypothetical protein [uncultured Flavobacterium sp.]